MPVEGATVPTSRGIIEGERLRASARATAGPVDTQDLDTFPGDWSDLSQLWWRPTRSGARLDLTLNAPETKTYELIGYFTRARDYGDIRLSVNNRPVGPVVKGYSPEVVPTGPVSFGRVPLRSGANAIAVEVVGKDTRSAGYLVGIDGFVLKP